MNARSKDIFREIRKSFGRFLSILLIVAVGVGFFVGVKATAPSMYRTADAYFNRQDLMDLEILSTVGFDDGDVEKIREIDHVSRVMPTYSADVLIQKDKEVVVTNLIALPEEGEDSINAPFLLEGRMPEAENEALLVRSELFDIPDFELGEEVTFSEESGDTKVDDILKRRSYTIVGFVNLPQFISYSYGTSSVGSGEISLVMLIPKTNFTYPRYTGMYVTLDCKEQGITSFSEDYDAIISDIKGQLETLGDIRYHAFVEDSKSQIRDAESEFNSGKSDAESELNDAKTQLEDARKQIDDGLRKLQQGWVDYEAGSEEAQKQIEEAEKQIADYKKQLADGEAELASAESSLESMRNTLDVFLPDYSAQENYDAALAERDQAASEVVEAETKAVAAQAEVTAAQLAVTEAKATQDAAGQAARIAAEQAAAAPFETEIATLEGELASANSELQTLDPEDPEYDIKQSAIQLEIETLEGQLATARSSRDAAVLEAGNSETIQMARDAAQPAVDAAQETLDSAQLALNEVQSGLSEAQSRLATAEADLATAQRNLNYLEEYDALKAQIDQEIEAGRAEIEAGRRELEEGRRQIAEAEAELELKKAEAEAELENAYNQLISSEAELDEARKQYNEGLEEYREAIEQVENELSTGMNRIQNAKQELGGIISGKWYVFSRDDIMVNHSNFKMDAQRIDAIADVFPVFFLLVAALVCLTTMSRMIDEQRIQMGTYKALGYKPMEIMAKYLIYAALASIGGCVVGPIICVQILPRVIFGAYGAMYKLPDFSISVPYDMFAVSVVVALLCTVLVAYISCWKELRSTTAALMRPKAPKAGKKILLERITPLWKCFSFFQKLTARNLFRYKVRLFMTVLGIAGCMALVVAGFGLNNAITPIVSLQYDAIQHDDVFVTLDQNYTYKDVSGVVSELKENECVENCLLAGKTECKVLDMEGKISVGDSYTYVPQNCEDAEALLTLRDPSTYEKVAWTDDGAIITEKISKELGVGIGDSILVFQNDQKTPVTVVGIVENYIYNYVYMTPAYYQKNFEKEPLYNTIFISESDKMVDRDAFSSEVLRKFDQIIIFFYTDSLEGTMTDTLASMKTVVFVMILCAGILAFIVLYNLTNINLSERMREIATVKVLGFNRSETNSYVFRENIIMSIMGILLGSVLGYMMAQYLISTVEVSTVTFSRNIHWTSYVFSAGITMGFTILVNLFMKKHVKAISMVESLKAIE